MSPDEARKLVDHALAQVAPEIDPATIDPSEPLQADLDIDSIDFLNLVEGVAAAIGRDIPESDYGQLATLQGFVDYVAASA
jgi:acyl carrier protein